MEIELKRNAYSKKFKDVLISKNRYVCLFGSRGCFGKKQKITTRAGLKKIYKIKKGDFVKSFNEKNNTIEYKEVINIFKYENKEKCLKINYDNKEIICTFDHKFYYKGEFVEIAKILKENGINIPE